MTKLGWLWAGLLAGTRAPAPPRVLLVVGREVGTGGLKEIYAAGPQSFLDEVLKLAGGRNALDEAAGRFPRLGPEDVVRLDPDCIIDLMPPAAAQGLDAGAIVSDWSHLQNLGAVRNHRVFAVLKDYALVPGPRYILLAEDLKGLMFPTAVNGELRRSSP